MEGADARASLASLVKYELNVVAKSMAVIWGLMKVMSVEEIQKGRSSPTALAANGIDHRQACDKVNLECRLLWVQGIAGDAREASTNVSRANNAADA